MSTHIIPLGGDRCILRGCSMTREEIAQEGRTHMTDLERKTAAAWAHLRQAGSAFVEVHDGLRAGYRELQRAKKVTIHGSIGGRGRWMVRLAGDYLRAFLAGEDVPT